MEFYDLNEVLRFCRYTPGQHFGPHFDGYFERNSDERSYFTFTIYLNDDFKAGITHFLKQGKTNPILYKVIPATVMALVFPYEMLYNEERLESGVKYIMRSDIMYKKCKK